VSGYAFAADLHETDRPADEYRWAAFDFILSCSKLHNVEAIVLGGDVTDVKDGHKARLLHRIKEQVVRLSEYAPVWWVMGNHDYRDRQAPFFKFLDDYPRIHFIAEPSVERICGDRVLCIPHTRSWSTNVTWRKEFLHNCDYKSVIAHQTFKGARASNGELMNGPPATAVSEKILGAPVFAGDIHVPQRVGNVTYVGSPHSINFGDHFKPRILHVQGRRYQPLENAVSPIRWKLNVTPDDLDKEWLSEVFEGDQIKVGLTLTPAQALDVADYREVIVSQIEATGATWHGTGIKVTAPKSRRARLFSTTSKDQGLATPGAVLAQYAAHRQLEPEIIRAMGKYL